MNGQTRIILDTPSIETHEYTTIQEMVDAYEEKISKLEQDNSTLEERVDELESDNKSMSEQLEEYEGETSH